jgi:penicillin-binding protein A
MRPVRPVRASLELEDSRWRRDQLARRQRLRARGRATLAAIALTFAVTLVWLLDPLGPVRAGDGVPAPPAPALGEAAPAPDADLRSVPHAVLERLPVTSDVLDLPVAAPEGAVGDHPARGRPYERVRVGEPGLAEPLRVEYTFDAALTEHVFRVLRDARVDLGNAIVIEPTTGRVLAYASTDIERFPPTRSYPAASLVKVITAAAALDHDPEMARLPCRYRGSPYRLTPARLDPPQNGNTATLQRALATSNNQCFAQLAVHALGRGPLLEALDRFGWLSRPAPAHAAGSADAGDERYDLGRLGCGLAGVRITPLHAAQLAASLVHGELVTPRWIERVEDAKGRELRLPPAPTPRRVISPELTAELRSMLVATTISGTARSAFRDRRGRPLLGPVRVAGKTGSLSGKDPAGRYEWFIGVAPAESPRVAVATVVVQGPLWWRNASQVAASVLQGVFCERGRCDADLASRFIPVPETAAALAQVPAPTDAQPN